MSLLASPPEKSIVYQHLSDRVRRSVFILDSVHIFKCIKKQSLNRCIVYPDFNFYSMRTKNSFELAYASFEALKHLHRLQSHQTLKFVYKLSVKAPYPSNLES